ncbi:MAG: sulfotransferase [Verrucomicrobiaceae bacterium]|nr:sulfotransferase [Verrucomicrobiaceae bacterium]
MPVRLLRCSGEEIRVEWCHVGRTRFTEPFFEQNLHQLMRVPFNVLFRQQTTLEEMIAWSRQSPGIPPTGFIFHMSRCGSTLVSQMLGRLERHLVLSEPPALDTLLRATRAWPEERRIEAVRAWFSASAQPRSGEDRFFVKLDAWHALELPLLRRAFPETPWIFIHRDPIEVLVSALRQPGYSLIPGAMQDFLPQFDVQTAVSMPQADYIAQVLAACCQAALNQLPCANGLAIDYRELPGAITGRIARHFGLDLSPVETATMRTAETVHSKSPREPFSPDSQDKQQSATAAIHTACANWLVPRVEKLRGLRGIS